MNESECEHGHTVITYRGNVKIETCAYCGKIVRISS